MTGITRSAAAKIIAEHFGTSAVHVGGTYDTYTVEDDTGRKWKVVSDASIQCQSRGERTASRLYAVEVVSPICKYEDIETIQELVRELRRGGAKVNDSCGIHIHVDASRHDPKTLRNIVNIMASKEDLSCGLGLVRTVFLRILRFFGGFIPALGSQAEPPERAFSYRTQPHLINTAAAAIQALQPDCLLSAASIFSGHSPSPTAEAEAPRSFFLGFWLSTFMSTKARTLAGTIF